MPSWASARGIVDHYLGRQVIGGRFIQGPLLVEGGFAQAERQCTRGQDGVHILLDRAIDLL